MIRQQAKRRAAAAGFTMIELLIAILLLMLGIVPLLAAITTAMERNLENRYDSTGLILCQRQLELMLAADLEANEAAVVGHYSFNATQPDGTAVTIRMGSSDMTNPTSTAGAATTLTGGQTAIDWIGQNSAAVPVGYRDNFLNAEGYQYETRWSVTTFFMNIGGRNQPVGKRIIVSTRGGPPGQPRVPTTIMSMVGMR
jgi:Tfp pilus assembly protein PilV